MGNGDRKQCLVVGLGNPLMRDEGVGVKVLELLKCDDAPREHVEFLDGGTGGVALVHAMAGREKAIFIDCAQMSEKAGTIRRFEVDDIRSTKDLPQMSLHEADLLQIIGLADQLGKCPPKITLFGIEPQTVEPGHDLSPVLSEKVASYAGQIAAEYTD